MSWWEFWKPKKERLDFIRQFLELNAQSIPGIRGIDQLNFTVLDTETTGFDPVKDSILSFGAVQISGMKIQISTAVEWYPLTENTSRKTAPIHGLVEIAHPLEVEDFSKRLLEYFGNSILVGHHVSFDLQMLGKLLAHYGISQFPNPVIDTLRLAIRLEHGPNADLSRINMESYSLDELCKRYGIETDDRHTAAGDAFLTAQLFLKLLKNCSKKGIFNFKDLMKNY
ncbi:3'-5' exonuclease [Algoriphagus lacus]|uniref:3'-5' exonuclease n=1 Tax=Algoriphagus lacus TaxID=2056311 RepID=A0A418PX76_9BACT|nr:3'-5' exonuclease [Algoriphagus lacus]RIW18662.1 3'-5' exonuclease [Algoriphagus lacus]